MNTNTPSLTTTIPRNQLVIGRRLENGTTIVRRKVTKRVTVWVASDGTRYYALPNWTRARVVRESPLNAHLLQ